jgi:arginase
LRFAIAAEFDTTGVGLKSEAVQPFEFIGVPIDSVGRDGGAEHGPAALRTLGLPALLGGEDRGDLAVSVRGELRDPETGILAGPDVLATTATIRTAVAERIGGGARPFLAGGCCAELPGALAGARDALGSSVGLVHLDGHLDLYDGGTSPTGEAADMPVSVALGLGPDGWVTAAGGASVTPERLALVGFRDRAESLEYGMRQPETIEPPPMLRPVEDLRAAGPGLAATEVASTLAEQGPFWLHFDVDVLDQDVFPATDYLMPGGLNWTELQQVLAPLLASPQLIGASLGCYNPDKDPNRSCGRALVEVLSA